MRAREFAFWLQGFFELNGRDEALSVDQSKLVLQKLQKVQTGTDLVEQSAGAYVQFAKGALTSIEFLEPYEQAKVLVGITAKLRVDLDNLFVHAIDPSMPGDQEQHRSRHRPDGKGPGLEVLC